MRNAVLEPFHLFAHVCSEILRDRYLRSTLECHFGAVIPAGRTIPELGVEPTSSGVVLEVAEMDRLETILKGPRRERGLSRFRYRAIRAQPTCRTGLRNRRRVEQRLRPWPGSTRQIRRRARQHRLRRIRLPLVRPTSRNHMSAQFRERYRTPLDPQITPSAGRPVAARPHRVGYAERDTNLSWSMVYRH